MTLNDMVLYIQAASEIGQSKVTSLELEMEAVIGDLKLEKQRLQGAQERIVLRYVFYLHPRLPTSE